MVHDDRRPSVLHLSTFVRKMAPKAAEKPAKEPKAAKGKATKGKATKEKKEKKKKDPNAPKKPLSAYMFFCADHREKIKEENPDMKVTEITSELGKAWKECSEADKKKYHEKAEKDKDRYKKAMDSYKGGDAAEEDEGEDEDDE